MEQLSFGQMNLFGQETTMSSPLANRLRPETLDDYVGQEHLVGVGKVLRQMIQKDNISSMIFWGTARSRKDDISQNHSQYDTCIIYKFQCSYKRNQGN